MPELLLEIGCEELPAGVIQPALGYLAKAFDKLVTDGRLAFEDDGNVRVEGTPRRLVLHATGLPLGQEGRTITVTGPPARAAFDADGNPTKAAQGFARGKGVDVESIFKVETEKGEYIAVKIEEPGVETAALLAEKLPALLGAVPFPKSMRWGKGTVAFSRPVHWIVALFDGQIVPFEFAGIDSGDETRGHRFHAPERQQVHDAADYRRILREARVMVDIDGRRAAVETQVEVAAVEVGGRPRPMPDLVDEVANLVEWPVAITGRFDEALLALPQEVLVSEMTEHQRYFPVENDEGQLLPYFVAVSNTEVPDRELVARGYTRVLAARFDDARFFFSEDQKRPLPERVEELDRVVFQRKLGSIGDKVRRIRTLVAWVCERLELGAEVAETADRVAQLCKADLTTGMVFEFPELQGIMGDYYGRAAGESEAVATGIREHYQPKGQGDDLPSTTAGAVVAICDRADTLAGIIGIGKRPSGSADPFALRRACLGIIRILLDQGWRLPVPELVEQASAALTDKIKHGSEKDVVDFFSGRLKGVLTDRLPNDVADAVLSASELDVVDIDARARALESFRGSDEWAPLAEVFRRATNITKDVSLETLPQIDPARLEPGAEKALFDFFSEIRDGVEDALDARSYGDALAQMATLRPRVSDFFDDVMVMAEDEALRHNRLRLLSEICAIFGRIADFGRLQASQS